MSRRTPDVLVVGAGPVGLLTALTLVDRGLRVQVVDKEWRTGAHSYALALHRQSLELLDRVGLGQFVRERAYPVRTVGLFDGATRRAELQLLDASSGSDAVCVMRQHALEGLLEKELERRGVKVQWNHEVSRFLPCDDRVQVTVNKLVKDSTGYATARTEWVVAKSTELDVPFVIGADGHRSVVRRALDIEFAEVAESLHFAVFEFQSNMDVPHEMRVVMDPTTTNVLWPLPNGCFRWSFQLTDAEAPATTRVKDRVGLQLGADQFPVLAEENLHAFIAQRAPWFTGSIDEVLWRIVVRFESRLAETFGRGRMWLAGDAGHLTGPVGMQSMNVGLREGCTLAGIVADISQNGDSLDRLEKYNDDRIHEWRRLLGLEGGLIAQDTADDWIRDRCDRLLPCLPASGSELARLAEQWQLTVT